MGVHVQAWEPHCNNGWWACPGGSPAGWTCIPPSSVCDGYANCPNGGDEENCNGGGGGGETGGGGSGGDVEIMILESVVKDSSATISLLIRNLRATSWEVPMPKEGPSRGRLAFKVGTTSAAEPSLGR